ncbi:hypothetical protein ACWCO9_08100, partial [Streptomyces sp. NPDC001937]
GGSRSRGGRATAVRSVRDRRRPGCRTGGAAVDLTARLGHCSGALGVVQAAAGVAHLAAGGPGPVLATSGGGETDDAAAALVLTGAGEVA